MTEHELAGLVLAPSLALNYRVDGPSDAATSILFLNGASLPLGFWDPIVAALARDYRCIRFDQRNAGATRFTGTFALTDVAADAAALVASLGVETVVVAGHAWGGRVAQVFARDYPHLTEALIICGTGGQLPAQTDPDTLTRMGRASRERDRKTWADAMHASFCGASFRDEQPEAFGALCDLLWENMPPRTAKWDARVSPSPSYWGMAACPCLLVYGDEDLNGTLPNAEDLAGRLGSASLHVLPGVGHFVIREAPGEVVGLVREFLRGLAPKDP